MAEFDERAALYHKALEEHPRARYMDYITMSELLFPLPHESILEVGGGNGFFAPVINGFCPKSYTVVDPSAGQLRFHPKEVEVVQEGIESFCREETYDKIWSFGAFHHCPNQTQAMKNMYASLKKGGRMVLCDVFQGSTLAEHFDSVVAKYCVVGHEVKFLSEAFASTLCELAGFSSHEIKDLPQEWIFENEEAMGDFMYDLHALTRVPNKDVVIEGCNDILGAYDGDWGIHLPWPMKAIIAKK